MRKICLLATLFLSQLQGAPADSYARLKQLLPLPPAEFSTLPFFVWNGEMTEAEVDRVLNDYQSQGIRGFFIHPRPGMMTPYLSDRWFQLVRYTVDRAKKLGMETWLYDENSYPSGFAGGNVPAQMPESYNQGQGLVPRKSGPCVVLLKRGANGFEDVSGRMEPGSDTLCYGTVQFPVRGWNGGFSYVDLLYPGVTQKFIDITMRGYEKTLGADLGKAVPGIFTDEPHIDSPDRNGIKYTPDLFDQFQKRWGYSLKTSLPSLFEETGDWRKVRHNYYGLLLELFIERWSKPWYDYTTKSGIAWTGHYWEHGWPNPGKGPDHMAMYAWHHVPAIDMLFNQFNEEVNAQFGNVRSVKELASVANQMGRRRTLSETYGGAGWELRFEDMKRLGDWEYALGVNMMNQHLSFQTLAGARKYDYPQSFTYHTPWWKQYHVLAGYFARLSLALSSGEQRNRILVLEPTTSAWMYAGVKPNARMTEIGKQFQAFITRLEHAQVEYDLGSENIIKDHGKVNGARFVVGKRDYDLLVLPPGTENLDAPTARLVRQYLQAGGKIASFAQAALAVDGVAGAIQIPQSPNVPVNIGMSGVEGQIFHQRRQLADGELWFFVNSSLESNAHATVKTSGKSIEKLDLFTGKAAPYPSSLSAGALGFSVELPPAGSILLVARNTPGPAAKPERRPEERSIESASPLVVARLAPNAIRIDYCDLNFKGTVTEGMYFYQAADKIFKSYGFVEGNPWNTAVQYKTSILDRNKFAQDSGFEATFWFDLAEGVDTASLRAVVERPALWKVLLNGKPVESRPGEWWLDAGFGVYEIGSLVKPGRNSISIAAHPMSVHNELEPVYVIGNFGAAPQAKGFRLVPTPGLKLGSWKQQDLPFYSDSVSYGANYALKFGGEYKVALAKWAGTVAEVRVNGKSAGIVGWQPYELPIGEFVKNGDNRIEVIVYGSLKNLLGPHHGKIVRGLTSPQSFRSAPTQMPPGSAYDQEAYGLMEPFRLIETK